MIKKWTVRLSKQALKKLKNDVVWRRSKGFERTLRFAGHFMCAQSIGGFLRDRGNLLETEMAEWGESLVKCLFVGWAESSDYREAFRRGTRATINIGCDVFEGGTRLEVVFHGRNIEAKPVSWEFEAVFTADGKLGMLQGGVGTHPREWFNCP